MRRKRGKTHFHIWCGLLNIYFCAASQNSLSLPFQTPATQAKFFIEIILKSTQPEGYINYVAISAGSKVACEAIPLKKEPDRR